jgi:hypothetical protein
MTEKLPTLDNKDVVLSKIKASYSRLYDFVEGLEGAAITKSLEQDDWTIKDILAHIAAWEDVLSRFHIQAQPFDQVVGMESANYRDTEEDEVNERFYQRYRDWSGEQVVSFARATHEHLIEILEALPEGALSDPPAHYGGEAPQQNPLINYIAGNTYKHYEEHLRMIQEILDQTGHSEE